MERAVRLDRERRWQSAHGLRQALAELQLKGGREALLSMLKARG